MSLKWSLCIGAYQGKDEVCHLEKIKERGFDGLEYYAWWNQPDIRRTAAFADNPGRKQPEI